MLNGRYVVVKAIYKWIYKLIYKGICKQITIGKSFINVYTDKRKGNVSVRKVKTSSW